MKAELPTVIFAIIIGLLFVGSLLAYPLNPNGYDAELNIEGDKAIIDMHSSIESEYTVCSIEFKDPTQKQRTLYVYYDESYDSFKGHNNEESDLYELNGFLNCFGIRYKLIDAAELENHLLSLEDAKDEIILIQSGGFPSNVYSSEKNLPKTWMESGGLICWYSWERFGYYSLNPVDSSDSPYQPKETNEFGISFKDGTQYASDRTEYSKILNITQNKTGPCAAVIDTNVTSLGYNSDDGRSSMAFVQFGSGGTVINGGDWTPDSSMARVIASQVFDWSDYTSENGSFKGDEEVTLSVGSNDAFFVSYGELVPRFGKLFVL